MLRIVATTLVASLFFAFQSGCCCCRLPMMGARPIVLNPPPIVIDPQPIALDPGLGPKQYTYSLSTGQLKLGQELIGTGYSGKGPARNNAAMQNLKGQGPIPTGEYIITGRRDDFNTGEPIIGLMPAAVTNTYQRWPGENFEIQPETNPPGNASGIVMPRNARERIDTAPFTKLIVVP
jgi:hypothetical protein